MLAVKTRAKLTEKDGGPDKEIYQHSQSHSSGPTISSPKSAAAKSRILFIFTCISQGFFQKHNKLISESLPIKVSFSKRPRIASHSAARSGLSRR